MAANTSYCIYVLREPLTREVRYVGLTGKSLYIRLKGHLKEKEITNPHKYRWLRQLDMPPLIESLITTLTLEDAKYLEIHLIGEYRATGSRLVNITNGGDAIMAGRKHKQSTLQIMRETRKGKDNAFYGKTHSPETRARLRAAFIGRPNGQKGRRFSEEHRRKLSLAKIGFIPHNKDKSRFDFHRIKMLYLNGCKMSQIAEVVGTDGGTISKIIRKKLGISL